MEEVMAERVSLSPNLISWHNYEACVRTTQRIGTCPSHIPGPITIMCMGLVGEVGIEILEGNVMSEVSKQMKKRGR